MVRYDSIETDCVADGLKCVGEAEESDDSVFESCSRFFEVDEEDDESVAEEGADDRGRQTGYVHHAQVCGGKKHTDEHEYFVGEKRSFCFCRRNNRNGKTTIAISSV